MTQEYTPSIETIIDAYASARTNSMQIQLSDEWNREHKRIVKEAMKALAVHDAEVLQLAMAAIAKDTARKGVFES